MNWRRSWGLWLSFVLAAVASSAPAQSFSRTKLVGTDDLGFPTTLQWGPDGRLYVGELYGKIHAYSVERTGSGTYAVTESELLRSIDLGIQNHNDDGSLHTGPSTRRRQVTGILVRGTALHPVIYVSSSDYRVAVGEDSGLDTNSGVITRLTWDGTEWQHLDIVRGLPRNEENHSPNGMWLDETSNTLYLAQGGNTNSGAPSNNFAFQTEYALSAAVLSIDLDAIGETTYDLPTLDDPDRPGNPDVNDPFGGNNGLNQAMLVPGGPVQVYASGFRNPYDLLKHSNGRLYTIDNGPNQGWGGPPIDCTNTPNELNATSYGDGLHLITGQGYYGGHPNPTRANLANTFAGQSPVAIANPVECDYLIPGVEDASLWVFPSSTNGLCEYTASNFANAMQGDILTIDVDGTLHRIELAADGTGVTGVSTLVQNGGDLALDVVARGDGDTFAGTIWYTAFTDKAIYVMEPLDFTGCTGENSFELDEDGDGFSNADEIANGTDVCSPASVPSDFDGDFISDLLDTDDDNDGITDEQDPFALDASNGLTEDMPFFFGWSAGEPGYGFYGLGFTGLMANGFTDYADQFDPANLTAGGAAGRLTIDRVSTGSPANGDNAQDTAFQLGLWVGEHKGTFRLGTELEAPFFDARDPMPGQSMGFFVGTGDQDNYVSIELTAVTLDGIKSRLQTIARSPRNQSGRIDGLASGLRRVKNAQLPGIRVTHERAGVIESVYELAMPEATLGTSLLLDMVVDPGRRTIQPRVALPDGEFEPVGPPITAEAEILAVLLGEAPLASGVLASSGGAPAFAGTWDYFESEIIDSGARATFRVITPNPGLAGSTFSDESFRVENHSIGGQRIDWIEYDFTTGLLDDLVVDPDGLAGDEIGKGFTPDAGAVETGFDTFEYGLPKDFGYQSLRVAFTNFDSAEDFRFSLDMDPTSIQGAIAPGPFAAGSINGLELVGTKVRVGFSDGTVLAGTLSRDGASLNDAVADLRPGMASKPGLEIVGYGSGPFDVSEAEQTLRVTGPRGAGVRIFKADGGLFLEDLPGGGFDIDPFEANSIVGVQNISATIGEDGYVDVPITLSRRRVESGINHIIAYVETPDGFGLASNRVVARIRQTAFTSDPEVVDFGPVLIGFSEILSVDITNETQAPLTLESLELTGSPDVSIIQSPELPVLVPVSASVEVVLQATPVVEGFFDATLIATSSGPVTTAEIPVTGKAEVPAMPSAIAFRLNAGGSAAAPVMMGQLAWSGDTPGDPYPLLDVDNPAWIMSALPATIPPPLEAVVPQGVATTSRVGLPGEVMTLSVPVARDEYTVSLFFAELDPGVNNAGQRVFDISAEGASVATGVDMVAEAGQRTVIVRTFNITVVDTSLDIQIIPTAGGAALNGVEVRRAP